MLNRYPNDELGNISILDAPTAPHPPPNPYGYEAYG